LIFAGAIVVRLAQLQDLQALDKVVVGGQALELDANQTRTLALQPSSVAYRTEESSIRHEHPPVDARAGVVSWQVSAKGLHRAAILAELCCAA
jgi:hypothetical protein